MPAHPHCPPSAPREYVSRLEAAMRAGSPDPTRALTLPAGDLFDLVSVDLPLGLDALDLLLRSGAALGPVVADTRCQVRRAGFLLPPGTLARARGLAWWCRSHGLRTTALGSVVTLPPLLADPAGRLQWLVPPSPGQSAGTDTHPAALLAALRRARHTAAAQHRLPPPPPRPRHPFE
jgi:hypothetical protein